MSDEDISRLLRQAPFSFVGTVEHRSAATMTDIPIDDWTAVVRVDYVLHSPEAFSTLQGHRITVQLAADKEPPAVGDALAFFAEGLAFGDSVAVAEVGRLPVDAVEPRVTSALAAGEAGAFATLQREIEMDRSASTPARRMRSSWAAWPAREGHRIRLLGARPRLVAGDARCPSRGARHRRAGAADGSLCEQPRRGMASLAQTKGFAGGSVDPPRHGRRARHGGPLPDRPPGRLSTAAES